MYDAIVVGARVAGAPTAMLLARKGYRVLLVDRASFPSDTMSTHYIHPPGVALLKRWGVLAPIVATGYPLISHLNMRVGPYRLSGWGPPSDGVAEVHAPRRTILDKILVDAAAAAGVEVRERFSVQEILRDGGRVTGIRGHVPGGAPVTEQARVVIGADGIHSAVARAVDAPRYNERPALACYYYSYWSGVGLSHVEYGADGNGRVFGLFPTNEGLTVSFIGLQNHQFAAYRADIEGTFYRGMEACYPEMAARLRAGRQEERWAGTADLPNFFRKPYGPGWALVGDAGYHKDPITGYGITDAFLQAQWLTEALDAAFLGTKPWDEALSGYEQQRNAFDMPMYDFICLLASLQPLTPEQEALFAALEHNQEATNRFMGVIDGTVSAADFFSPDSLGSILAAAEPPVTA
jgi:flavin-dependent dehydrogenase